MKKIIFTGGSGKFGKVFKRIHLNKRNIFYPSSGVFDITSLKNMEKFIKKIRPKIIIHAAAISKPMRLHEKNIIKSINTNILGTLNLVKVCSKFNIKIIYFSTNYVYPFKNGNYKENDPLLPINSYAWSKLGGEASVQIYKNSLILRICMTEKPFIHKKAFANMKTNFMFHEDLAKNLVKLLKFKGVINVGGPTSSIYNFAKKSNSNVKKIFVKKNLKKKFPLDSTMNISKYRKILKK